MTARAIGEIIAPIVARCEALAWLHTQVRKAATPAARKETILLAHEHGMIDAEIAEDMISSYQLETA